MEVTHDYVSWTDNIEIDKFEDGSNDIAYLHEVVSDKSENYLYKFTERPIAKGVDYFVEINHNPDAGLLRLAGESKRLEYLQYLETKYGKYLTNI